MKKITLILMLGFILSACGNEESTIGTETNGSSTDKVEENVTTTEKEMADSEDKEAKSVEENTDKRNPLTQEEFNQKYQLDSEMDQYPNGKFELKDGTIINADSHEYLGGETFDYASAIFLDGKIGHLLLELKEGFTQEDVLSEFGFSGENVEYIPGKINNNIIEIVVDERFADENINRFPNEWD